MKSFVGRSAGMGFTLIELLVVVGIIGILIAATLPLMGGARDSAMAAKCMANMRNIAEATIICANRNGEDKGWYPAAGYYRSVVFALGSTKPHFVPRHAWISNYGNPGVLNKTVEHKRVGDVGEKDNGKVAHFTDAPNYSDPNSHNGNPLFAIKNGAIWSYTGNNFEVYRCPVHTQRFEKKHKYPPAWSFMMNQQFGYDGDNKRVHGWHGASIKSASIHGRNPDKVLMFAEVQGEDIEDKKHKISLKALVNGADFKTDAVLEYGKEEIGFNHPHSKGRYCGHVAFADGHVEKIIMPTKQGNFKKLTEYLCTGRDVVFDGSEYTEAKAK